MLDIDVRRTLGAFTLRARFRSDERLTALFGPSGSGKTSLIDIIGGLARPDAGRVAIGGRVLVDTAQGVHVPRHKRRIGMVFQDARLFPHLSVRQNLVYGRWFTPAAERYEDFDRVVELLGVGHLLARRPDGLSGGERQRVAIGRALLSSPRLLLMDEPLASLDDARKGEILPYIERLRDETRIPIVYVSHSVAEVARLAQTVAVLSAGRVAALGPTSDILRRLDLLAPEERGEGGAMLDMVVDRHEDDGMTTLRSPAGAFLVPRLAAAVGASVRVRLRARDVLIATQRPQGLSAQNVLDGTVAAIAPADETNVDVRIDCGGQAIASRITRRSLQTLGINVGDPVFAVVKTVAFGSDNLSRAALPPIGESE